MKTTIFKAPPILTLIHTATRESPGPARTPHLQRRNQRRGKRGRSDFPTAGAAGGTPGANRWRLRDRRQRRGGGSWSQVWVVGPLLTVVRKVLGLFVEHELPSLKSRDLGSESKSCPLTMGQPPCHNHTIVRECTAAVG